VGRIVKPDTGAHMKLKQKGTSVPTLEKAQSRIDENVSERLIGQAFEVMFKEFERYIKIMKGFKGVDWTVYVKMRNKERKNGDAKKDYEDEKLFDEEEEESPAAAASEENKEEEKKEEGPKNDDEEEKSSSKADEEKPVAEEEEKKASEEEKKASEEEKKEGGENEEDKKDEEANGEDIQEKEKQEAIKKQEERAEKEMKSIYKLYSESFLRRLLRLVEIFTSIATVSQYPLSMVQKVANPY
jgi:hypothetical protein